ncbi:MAG: cytochrome PufQ [Sedimentitalea sp.]
MTDFTTDATFKPTKRTGPRKGEYRVYFALIFLVALAPAFLVWALSSLGLMDKKEHGPIKSAWSHASTITPKIFWV